MLTMTKNIMAVLVLVLMFVSASFAQQPSPSPVQKSESDSVSEKGFKSRVFEIKYRNAESLLRVLWQLGSGFKGSAMSANHEFKTISVRDFPENLTTIEEAIKRLDTPAPARPNIELHMHVLIASNMSGIAENVPAEIKDVITQLRGTLTYRNYELAATVLQRLTETQGGLRGVGTAETSHAGSTTPNVAFPYGYNINSVSLVQNPGGAMTIQIAGFMFETSNDKDRAQVQTALNLRDGEKVVVGTATMRDRALIIVLIAKVVN